MCENLEGEMKMQKVDISDQQLLGIFLGTARDRLKIIPKPHKEYQDGTKKTFEKDERKRRADSGSLFFYLFSGKGILTEVK